MNVAPKPKTRVLIAVPVRRFNAENADADCPEHLKELLHHLNALPDSPYVFEMMLFGGGNVARGRNKIVGAFLRGSWSWLVWLDDDVWNEIEEMVAALLRILSHRLHVCGALYTTKEENAKWVLNTYREPVIDAQGLLVVVELGTGGMKTYHRSVFTTLIEKEPDLGYVCRETAAPEWGLFCQGLMMVEGKREWLPEDYWLDHLCKKHGIAVHVDTTIKLRHHDIDGKVYPLDDDWPDLPGPTQAIAPPPMAEDFEPGPVIQGRLVIALQYWAGDRDAAMRLARFVADLEPEFREDVEICFVHRHDALPPDQDTWNHVADKFNLHVHRTPEHLVGYPVSPNAMALDVMVSARSWHCDAVLLLEADCVPVARDWIDQLKDDWRRARGQGKLVLGSWRPECGLRGHINGNMLFHPSIALDLGLRPPPPKKAWDIFFVQFFWRVWMRTGLIANRYQEMFVAPAKLAVPECGTRPPVLIHGIKDESAWKYAQAQTGVRA